MPEKGLDIFLIGRDTLNRGLLHYVLSSEIECRCTNLQSLDGIAPHEPSDGLSLVLIDAESKDIATLVLELIASRGSISTMHNLCVYNLKRNTRIEGRCLQQGICGFFYIDDSLSLLFKGVNAVMAGEIWIPREVLLECALNGRKDSLGIDDIKSTEKTPLTKRESEILMMVCLGRRNEEIAESLFISAHTVKTHLYNIFKKINVPNRLQAALWASKNL